MTGRGTASLSRPEVLDHDPERLPPGIESTVAGLDAADLRRAARASAEVLDRESNAQSRAG